MDFWSLVLGWVLGYVWCLIWRTGRPEKISLLALVVGWMLGRRDPHRDRHIR